MIKRLPFILLALVISAFLLSSVHAASEYRGVGVFDKDFGSGKAGCIHLYDKMTAVIIGIDRYQNLSASKQLSLAVKDAKGVEKVLRENYTFDRIITLYNEQATRENIIKTLQGDLSSLGVDDGVLIYFSGHGVTYPTIQKKDLGFLVPHDGSLEQNEMYKNISMLQLKSEIAPMVPAKHLLIIADACFGGLLLDTRSASVAASHKTSYLRQITSEPVRQIITAGGKGETVLDGGPRGHSVFTGRLIEALADVDDFITAKEIGVGLQRKVYGDAAARGHKQRPQVGEIYGTGDFVFVPDLEKRNHDLSDEVTALEKEMVLLQSLKEEAARAKDEAKQRQIEQERLQKESELKLAKISQQQSEEAALRQKNAAEEAARYAKEREQQEKENEQRLAKLRLQTEKMKQELGGDLTGGATIESAVKELKWITKQKEEIEAKFEAELQKQAKEIIAFYDKKIASLTDTSPWDKEFETAADYQSRLAQAERKAGPAREEKNRKLAGLKQELTADRDGQVEPLERQIKILLDKRFTVPASAVSFTFSEYKPGGQIMLGELAMSGGSVKFYCPLPKEKAKQYKKNPDLLVPEVKRQATLKGAKFDQIVFHAPEGTGYIGKLGADVSDDGRFVDNGDRTVSDTRTGLMWAARDNDGDINWSNAKSYCDRYSGGGHTDWRLPAQDELAGLYNAGIRYKKGHIIDITDYWPWAAETRGSGTGMAASFSFSYGNREWNYQSNSRSYRALPVRSGK